MASSNSTRLPDCIGGLPACPGTMSAQQNASATGNATQENVSAISQQAPVPHLSPGTARKPASAATPATGSSPGGSTYRAPVPSCRLLEKEVRVKAVGQMISARLVDPGVRLRSARRARRIGDSRPRYEDRAALRDKAHAGWM